MSISKGIVNCICGVNCICTIYVNVFGGDGGRNLKVKGFYFANHYVDAITGINEGLIIGCDGFFLTIGETCVHSFCTNDGVKVIHVNSSNRFYQCLEIGNSKLQTCDIFTCGYQNVVVVNRFFLKVGQCAIGVVEFGKIRNICKVEGRDIDSTN